MTAFLQLARARIVEPLPEPGRENEGHVGVVQAVERAGGDEALEHAGRARTGEPCHPKKRGSWRTTDLSPALNFAPHQAHVHVGMVQEHAVQELVQRRVVRGAEAGGCGDTGKGARQEEGGCPAHRNGQDSLPRKQNVKKSLPLKEPRDAEEQPRDPKQEQEGEKGAKEAARPGLEGGELGIVIAVREHAVQDRHAADREPVQQGGVAAQQQKRRVTRRREQGKRRRHALISSRIS